MTSWPEVALGEICELKYGRSLKASDRKPGVFAVMGSNGQVGTHEAAYTTGETIVVGRKGSIGAIAFQEGPCWPIDTTYYIDRTTSSQDPRWLYWQLRQLGLGSMNKSAAVPGLNREDAYRCRLPLPPLPEQRRIASILDETQALLRNRQDARDRLSALVDAAFGRVDRSGPAVPLRDVLVEIQSGVSPVTDSAPAGHGAWGVLKLGAVSSGIYKPLENKALLGGTQPNLRHEVMPGDVLLARKNTPELVGASAYVQQTPEKLLLPDLIFRLVPRLETIESRYLQAAVSTPQARQEIRAMSGGSAASMSNVSKERLMKLKIPVPSLIEQRRFVAAAEQIDGLRTVEEVHLAKLDELFASLQHRAFRGEL